LTNPAFPLQQLKWLLMVMLLDLMMPLRTGLRYESLCFVFATLSVTTRITLLLATGFGEEVEQHTIDEPVSVLVTVTPAALVVMIVRQGTVVLLVPDMRISPVMVKLFPAESVVVISVVGIGAAELPVAASVAACSAEAIGLEGCLNEFVGAGPTVARAKEQYWLTYDMTA
jgi:hypothetical protein